MLNIALPPGIAGRQDLFQKDPLTVFEIKQLHAKATVLMLKEEHQEAVEAFQSLIPMLEALDAEKSNEAAAAVAISNEDLKDAYFSLATELQKINKKEEALPYFQKALKLGCQEAMIYLQELEAIDIANKKVEEVIQRHLSHIDEQIENLDLAKFKIEKGEQPMLLPARFVTMQQWLKSVLIIGNAVEVKINKHAIVPAYALQIDFGPALNTEHKSLTKRALYHSSAQLCSKHTIDGPSGLQGQNLLCTVNFPRKQVGKFMSDCLTTGVQAPELYGDEKRDTTISVKPSHLVELGARVNLLANHEIVLSNPRNLLWKEFSEIDLRIGTIESCKIVNSMPEHSTIKKIVFTTNLGPLGRHPGVGFIDSEIIDYLTNKQVMVLYNLERKEIESSFSEPDAQVVLCTINGKSVLEPAQPVKDGYKLA